MRLMLAALVPGLLVIAGAAHAVVFDDGMVHVIDAGNSYPFEAVVVEDSPEGDATRVEVVAGGEIGTISGTDCLLAYGKSEIVMTGGAIGHCLVAYDTSTASVSGGMVGSDIAGVGSSFVEVTGGTAQRLIAQVNSTLLASGGSFSEVNSQQLSGLTVISGDLSTFRMFTGETSSTEIAGGTVVQTLEHRGASLVISGGDIGRIVVFGSARIIGDGLNVGGDIEVSTSGSIIIDGGAIGGDLRLSNNGQATVLGGTFVGDLVALQDSVVTIHGTEFNHPWGPIQASSGTLIGTLVGTEDSGGPVGEGTPIDVPFGRASTASIILAQPLPIPALPGWALGALSMLLIGSAGWVMGTRKWGANS